jgi:hypothetical protein
MKETPEYLKYADKIDSNWNLYFSKQAKEDIVNLYEALKLDPSYTNKENFEKNNFFQDVKKAAEYAKVHIWTEKDAINKIKSYKAELDTNTSDIFLADNNSEINEVNFDEQYYKVWDKYISVAEWNKEHWIPDNNEVIITDNTQNNSELESNIHCDWNKCYITNPKQVKEPNKPIWNKGLNINNISEVSEELDWNKEVAEISTEEQLKAFIKKHKEALIVYVQDGCWPCMAFESQVNWLMNNWGLSVNVWIVNLKNISPTFVTATPTPVVYKNFWETEEILNAWTTYNEAISNFNA